MKETSFTMGNTFLDTLYSSLSIPEAIDKYCSFLQGTERPEDLAHLAKLLEYKDIIATSTTLRLRKVFDTLYNTLSRQMPNIKFRISARRKAYISLEQKIRKNLSEDKSLDLIRDLLGARIILLNGTISDCYAVMELLIRCCIQCGYTVCEENSHNSAKESLEKVSPFLGYFYYGITDYIGNPKENGYQSIHATFRNDFGKCFEVQVRTFDMHVQAGYGDSNHLLYKNQKYHDPVTFDRTKIQMYGYGLVTRNEDSSPKVIDLIGLEYSLKLLQRNKTF